MNKADLIIGAILIFLTGTALYKTIKNRRKGGCGCSRSCGCRNECSSTKAQEK